jgi:lysyl-tRNA synthetase class 2
LEGYQTETSDLNELMVRRREELEAIRKLGINPYPYEFLANASSREIKESYVDDAPQRSVTVAGRIMSLRRMGKASFCHVQDSQGRIQVYLKKDDLGDMYDAFRLLDIGDIIGIEGFVFRTKTGEVSVHAQPAVKIPPAAPYSEGEGG